VRPILLTQVDRKSSLMTDTAGGYHQLGKEFARHETVDDGKDEYVRGDAYSNTVEGYFATLKRGIDGTYHHVSEAHLKRSSRSSISVTTAAPSWALATASATTTCSLPSAESASPIGGLVKPLTKTQRLKLIKRIAAQKKPPHG
jgi:hypothetical protein